MNNSSDIKSSILVSIITPSYNQGVYIKDTIVSVSNQTYKNIDHIIIDSCSDDETDNVIKCYINKYDIKYIREKDNGQADAINKGLELAQGDIVCWLNSDDYYFDANVIEKVVNIFKAFPKVDVITADGYSVDDAGRFLMPISLPADKCMTFDYMKTCDHLLQPSTFWRRNTLRLDTSLTYVFDWDLFCDYFRAGKNFLYIRDCFSCYRIQATSKTFSDTAKRKHEILKILKKNRVPLYVVAWGYFMYMAYLISEYLNISSIKKIAKALNLLMSKLSGMRISAT